MWSRRTQSLADVIAHNRGRTSGFDYIRLVLACSVVVIHSFLLTQGTAGNFIWGGFYRPFPACVLPAFFALSGFLVAGSLLRSRSLYDFLVLRALRIVPALAFETVLTAIVLGPLLTKIALGEYLLDPTFRKYFLNIVGNIQYHLPGLFLGNPFPGIVNLQLWTVPLELECYAAIFIMSSLFLLRNKWVALALFVAASFYGYFRDIAKGIDFYGMSNVPEKTLLLGFLAGVVLFQIRDQVPHKRLLFAAAIIATIALLYHRPFAYFSAMPLAYIVAYIGVLDIPKKTFLLRGDYSYGVYLFGFPIQQSIVFLFPDFRIWYLNALICVPLSIVCAMLSWHVVEKRTLGHKQLLISFARFPIDIIRKPNFLRKKAESSGQG
jgi:peptidoglycan/LPS O-acetylase OafA/YrhL